jgi:RNA polymerase sigma-70 factor (ECF subfamily)
MRTTRLVFRDSFPPVVRVAYLIVGDWEVAREVAQDAFVQLLVHWPKVSTYENRGAWVRRVAIRRAVRVRSRPPAAEAGVDLEVSDGALEAAIDLRRAILSLPCRQRAAVVLYYLYDLPMVEVAETLRCAEGTAKTYLHRARQQLGLLLKEEVDDATR